MIVSRADWERLIEQLDDQADLAAVETSRAREVALSPEEFRRLCYTGAEGLVAWLKPTCYLVL